MTKTALVWFALASCGLASAADGALKAGATAASGAGSETAASDKQIAALLAEQQALIATLRRRIMSLPLNDPNAVRMKQQLALIEQRVNNADRYPRRRYISPVTEDDEYRAYYRDAIHKIEDVGTRDFPQAHGKKLYGELMMNLTIDARGRLLQTEIVRSSGNAELDRQSERIARSSGPFVAFSPALRKKADELVLTTRFRYVFTPAAPPADAPSAVEHGSDGPPPRQP